MNVILWTRMFFQINIGFCWNLQKLNPINSNTNTLLIPSWLPHATVCDMLRLFINKNCLFHSKMYYFTFHSFNFILSTSYGNCFRSYIIYIYIYTINHKYLHIFIQKGKDLSAWTNTCYDANIWFCRALRVAVSRMYIKLIIRSARSFSGNQVKKLRPKRKHR